MCGNVRRLSLKGGVDIAQMNEFGATSLPVYVCIDVLLLDQRLATRRQAGILLKCFRVLAVRVHAQLTFFSPRNHSPPATSMITAFSSPRCCYRRGDLGIQCVPRVSNVIIKSRYSPNERLTSRFSTLFIFCFPPTPFP